MARSCLKKSVPQIRPAAYVAPPRRTGRNITPCNRPSIVIFLLHDSFGFPFRQHQRSCSSRTKFAQDLAEARRRDARKGIDCDPEAFEEAIEVIKAGLAKGQGPAHIIEANPGKVPFGTRSLYNYLAGAKADTLTKLDLPRAVRYKPRNRSADGGKSPQIPRAALEGRRWSDFCALDPMDQENAVEMDTVVGRLGKDTQCVLTLFMRRIGFQFYILLPDKTASSVVEALDSLQDLCGPRFPKLFGVVLTDRGKRVRRRRANRTRKRRPGTSATVLLRPEQVATEGKGRAQPRRAAANTP